ncbi:MULTISPECIES: DUF5689 domain-containing protein [Cellulophaga]|uniref:DUF5689 domain-containing protein n=1 Tax=Cellulophaga TaxID=104264 RepID=UPI0026E16A04|nr:DUF5689 domain-containing protein [Cellulophaga sp. 1_MG-2023]MDO6767077.1 DUF5689 domain-containing protein [Cellulophaga sp. 1_MG-2023]
MKDRSFKNLEPNCIDDVGVNTTYDIVKSLYVNETIQIQEDLIIEGYVISSDEAGNFYSVLHFQDKASDPTAGFQIEIDLRDTYLFYPIGTKISIKLKGLYLGQSNGIYSLGGVFSAFGNASVGRLPATVIDEHIFVMCDAEEVLEPTKLSLSESIDAYVNTLVSFDNTEFVLEEVGQPFAIETEETTRSLIDCDDNQLELLNSGYSDFQAMQLPDGSGEVKGILHKENLNYYLIIRDLNDINFNNDRCEDVIDEFTSDEIFISEIADPNNNADARFIELYNTSEDTLSLKGWTLNRYTNANLEVGSSINLTGQFIAPKSTFVVATDSIVFNTVYGVTANLEGNTGSAADSNGDDNITLVDPFGKLIDIFGIVGEDGSGTNHEFEDGRAFRKEAVTKSNPIYTFAEWEIYNDTGDSGTINLPQNAPDGYTPTIR